jgi:hypothetical protein
MQHKKAISIFILGALTLAVIFGTVAYQTVLAATPTTTSTATTTQADPGWVKGKGPNGGYTSDNLANALGITVDELTAAYQEAYTSALNQAVSQGLITQAQADDLTTNGHAFPYGGRWEDFLSQNGIDFNTFLAEALNISVEELKVAHQTASYAGIDQAVTDGKITQEQADLMKGRYALYNDNTFQSSMQSAYSEAVNQAVAAGVITQSQADQILSQSTNMFSPGMGGWGGQGGHGGPRGRGGEGMQGDFTPFAP